VRHGRTPSSKRSPSCDMGDPLLMCGAQLILIRLQSSLGRILERTPRMPLGILVEPLMKEMRVCGHTAADLAFHNLLARHARLEPAQGLMLLDMMARVCVSDERADCRQSATTCLLSLLQTLRDVPSAADFVHRLARLALTLASSVAATHAANAPSVTRATSGGTGAPSVSFGATSSQLSVARKVAIVRVIERVARLHSPAYNTHLHVHYREAMTRRDDLVPQVVEAFDVLAHTLAGKRDSAAATAADAHAHAASARPADKRRGSDTGGATSARGEGMKNRDWHVRGSEDSVLRSETATPRAEGSPAPLDPSPPAARRSPHTGVAQDASCHAKKASALLDVDTRPPSEAGARGGLKKARAVKSRMSERGKGGAEEGAKERETAKTQKEKTEEVSTTEVKRQKRKDKVVKEEGEDRKREEEEQTRGPKISAEERRATNLERAKKLEEDKKAAILEKDRKREADSKAAAEKDQLNAGKEPTTSAADRRAANLERAKHIEEAKKAAILEKRNKGGVISRGNLPHLLSKEELQQHQSKTEREQRRHAALQGRPSSGLAGNTLKDANDSDDDDRLSMPDRDRAKMNRHRPASAKTRKRQQEIAEIKRKRQARILDKETEEAKAKAREQDIFRLARLQVEKRMAELKSAAGGGGFLGELDDEGSGVGGASGGTSRADESGMEVSMMVQVRMSQNESSLFYLTCTRTVVLTFANVV